jgi:hypothetical protein
VGHYYRKLILLGKCRKDIGFEESTSFTLERDRNYNEVKAVLRTVKIIYNVYELRDQPLLKRRHFKDQRAITMSKCCTYDNQQAIKWRLRRCSHELIATDAERTFL